MRLLCGSPDGGCTCLEPSIAAGRRWTSIYPERAIAIRHMFPKASWPILTIALHVFARDRLRSYSAAIREPQKKGHLRRTCKHRTRRYADNRIESDHRHVFPYLIPISDILAAHKLLNEK